MTEINHQSQAPVILPQGKNPAVHIAGKKGGTILQL
jgi:hypothetical protein